MTKFPTLSPSLPKSRTAARCTASTAPIQCSWRERESELSTDEWTSVFQQAGKLGMLHAHFTGGEPLARTDLTELIARRVLLGFTPISSLLELG